MNKKIIQIHIGNEIKKVVEKKGISIKKFGDKISCNRANVYDIFKRSSIDTNLLLIISLALEYNFFELFVEPNNKMITRTKLLIEFEISDKEIKKLNLSDKLCDNCQLIFGPNKTKESEFKQI